MIEVNIKYLKIIYIKFFNLFLKILFILKKNLKFIFLDTKIIYFLSDYLKKILI
jgi:hypothetical protein